MDQGGGENVIYVQVDEDGKVLNYTSQMAGGEQVRLSTEHLYSYMNLIWSQIL